MTSSQCKGNILTVATVRKYIWYGASCHLFNFKGYSRVQKRKQCSRKRWAPWILSRVGELHENLEGRCTAFQSALLSTACLIPWSPSAVSIHLNVLKASCNLRAHNKFYCRPKYNVIHNNHFKCKLVCLDVFFSCFVLSKTNKKTHSFYPNDQFFPQYACFPLFELITEQNLSLTILAK